MMSKRQRNHDLLCAYLEPFAVSRRVLVVAEGATELGERLLELGARVVHAFEIGQAPQRPQGSRVVVKPFGRGELDVRDGAFDLAVVPDAGALRDPEAVITRLRRLVGDEGVLVALAGQPVGQAAMASAEPSLGYYELYDLVSLQFENVVMVGQVPFSGAALAVLGDDDEEPEVTVDTQLVGESDPPQRFIAVASQSPVDVRPYVILQLPEPEPERAPPAAPSASRVDPERERAELAELRLRAEVLAAQLQEHRARVAESIDLARRLENEVSRRDERIAELEDVVRVASDAASQAGRALADAHAAAGSYVDIEKSHAEQRARVLMLGAELEEALTRAREFEALAVKAEQTAMVASALEAELIELSESHAAELGAFEEALRERGRAIQTLERELARRERIVQELLLSLEGHGLDHERASSVASAPTEPRAAEVESLVEERARLRANVEALAQDAARREGELLASKWRIEELTLGAAAASPSFGEADKDEAVHADKDEAVNRLLDEIEALRQALRQEHEARQRAEGEVQKQAALLSQARADRDDDPALVPPRP